MISVVCVTGGVGGVTGGVGGVTGISSGGVAGGADCVCFIFLLLLFFPPSGSTFIGFLKLEVSTKLGADASSLSRVPSPERAAFPVLESWTNVPSCEVLSIVRFVCLLFRFNSSSI